MSMDGICAMERNVMEYFKPGELQSIINKALEENQDVVKDLGRGGGKGLAAFLQSRKEATAFSRIQMHGSSAPEVLANASSSETQGQLVGTKEFSWTKVYCNRATSPWALSLTELVPEAFEFPAFDWPEKIFFWPISEEDQLVPSYTKLFFSSIATVAWAVQRGDSRLDFHKNSAKSSNSQT